MRDSPLQPLVAVSPANSSSLQHQQHPLLLNQVLLLQLPLQLLKAALARVTPPLGQAAPSPHPNRHYSELQPRCQLLVMPLEGWLRCWRGTHVLGVSQAPCLVLPWRLPWLQLARYMFCLLPASF